MSYTEILEALKRILIRSTVVNLNEYTVVVIANPFAGGFRNAKRLAACKRELIDLSERLKGYPEHSHTTIEVWETEGQRHATDIANMLLEKAVLETKKQWLIVLACGDGTTWEFLDGLTRAPEELVKRFLLLRLPLGTGNDGTDGWTLTDSLSRLFDEGVILAQPYVKVHPALGSKKRAAISDGHYRAFNIASIGLDAYVARMTNRLKAKIPGDSFKLWLDLATIFYDSIYKTAPMKIQGSGTIADFCLENSKSAQQRRYKAKISQNANSEFTIEGTFLLLAVGADGQRTYGSHQLILPDENNVCLIEKMSLFRKIALKTPIVSGKHKEFPEVLLASAKKLVVEYNEKILIQMDGEAVLLEPEDFPLTFEISAPVLHYLGRKDGKRHV